MTLESKIAKAIKSWNKIPDEQKVDLKRSYWRTEGASIGGVPEDGHTVIMLLDRQKPSVDQDYNFDEERIAFNKYGQIIYGFDSGCSCPSPWFDSYPDCYNTEKTWKDFVLKDTSGFDEDWTKECEESIDRVLSNIK